MKKQNVLTLMIDGTESSFTAADLLSVYSGKPGCCCGCNGKHSYASAHQALAGEHRGYEVSDDEVSDKAVTRVFNKLVANASELVVEYPSNVSFTTKTRIYIAYFLDGCK